MIARGDYEAAFERFVAGGANGLLVRPTPNNTNADLIVSLAQRYRLPAIYPSRIYVTLGGLMAYVVQDGDADRRAAEYVDRILRGARPEDLPVERLSRYELIVNMRTARELGLRFSSTFMEQVTEVVEP